MKNPALIASANHKLSHTATPKRDRLWVWTKCGKRIRTSTLVNVTPAQSIDRGYAFCSCAG